jgi:hypothetical protein
MFSLLEENLLCRGSGVADCRDGALRLSLPIHAHEGRYSNAQYDDYRRLKRREFKQSFPLSFSCEARWSSSKPRGTSGFGFWNDPFMMTGWRWPSLPKAFWFICESEKNKLSPSSRDEYPAGCRAMVVNTNLMSMFESVCESLYESMAAPLRSCFVKHRNGSRQKGSFFAKLSQQSYSAIIPNIDHWNHYRIQWESESILFEVNGQSVLKHHGLLGAPQGMVIWMDNQFAYFDFFKSTWGVERMVEEQSLELRNVKCSALDE